MHIFTNEPDKYDAEGIVIKMSNTTKNKEKQKLLKLREDDKDKYVKEEKTKCVL